VITEFDSLEWFYLKGRGWVAVVHYEGTPEHWTPEELYSEDVTVDGHTFVCRGVDMYRHMISPNNPYRAMVGLLE
jgi:hypothetical protein